VITYPIIVVGLIVLYILNSIKVLREYERGVIFRLGRVLPQPKGPGLILVFSPIDRMVRISLRLITMDIPPQDVITKDNVTVKVNAVLYFRVIDPLKCVIDVQDYITPPPSWPRRPCGASSAKCRSTTFSRSGKSSTPASRR